MMQNWGADAVRFMIDASEYGTYYADLAAELSPYLPNNGHVCDAGCGLGYLARELAAYCREVTAVDRSCAALAHLYRSADAKNLHIICEDIFSVTTQFDAMVFCYFGRTNEILHLAKKLCKGNVLIVKRDCSEHKFSLGEVSNRRHTVETITEALNERKVPFERKQIALELGQPFHDIYDAVRFFSLYNKSDEPVTEKTVRDRLISTNDPIFPLFLPSVRTMELIVFSANDLPEGCADV